MGVRRTSSEHGFDGVVELEPLDLVVDVPVVPSAREVWAGHSDRLIALARGRVGDDAVAQAVVRDVFAKALPRWEQLADPVAAIEQRVVVAADGVGWDSGGEGNSFRFVEEQSRRRQRRRRSGLAVAVGVVGVTALVTASLSSSDAAKSASTTKPTTTDAVNTKVASATTATTRVAGATVGSVLVASGNPLVPLFLPNGYRVTEAYRNGQSQPSPTVNAPDPSELTALNMTQHSLVRVTAAPAMSASSPVRQPAPSGEVVQVGDNVGDVVNQGFGHRTLRWTDRRAGIEFNLDVVGGSLDDLVAVAVDIEGSFDLNKKIVLNLRRGSSDWRVIENGLTTESVWSVRYENFAGGKPGAIQIVGRQFVPATQLLATAGWAFSGVPTLRIRNGRSELWFERESTGSDMLDAFIPAYSAAFTKDGQSLFVSTSTSREDLEKVIDTLSPKSNDSFDAMATTASQSLFDFSSVQQTISLKKEVGSGPPQAITYGPASVGFSCLILLNTNNNSQSCGQGDSIVWAYAQRISETGLHVVGGLVSSAVASIRAVPQTGDPIPIPVLTTPRIDGEVRTYFAELSASIMSDVIEFLDANGSVIARRKWLAPPWLNVDRSVQPTQIGNFPTGFDGIDLQIAAVKYVDGTMGHCVGLVETGSTAAFAPAPRSHLGCESKPVDDTRVLPEAKRFGPLNDQNYYFAFVPSDAVTAELVYALSPLEKMVTASTGLKTVAVGRVAASSEQPIELRFRAVDGRVVATVSVTTLAAVVNKS